MFNFHGLGRVAVRMVSLGCAVLLLAVSASAYTVIMKGGRRIEIPASFLVTPTTLTYEVSPGFQVTLQMAAIDIGATERANNESPGALLKRARAAPEPAEESFDTGKSLSGATRTITNRDLEATVARRRASESAYETRRRQLGLPTVEESRRRAAAEAELIVRELEQKRLSDTESEEYWRARATELRTEMAVLDAEINYVRAQLEQVPFSDGSGSFSSVSTVVPLISFGNPGGRRNFPGYRNQRPRVYAAPRGVGQQPAGRYGWGGGRSRSQFGYRRGILGHATGVSINPPFGVFPNTNVFGSSIPYDYSYERSALITHFNELAATRAGLNARWRGLEDEARRAGVPPGWLRE